MNNIINNNNNIKFYFILKMGTLTYKNFIAQPKNN